MPQANKNTQSLAKSFDVVAPGKTAPPTSSKPIIVTNRPMIKDPMDPGTFKVTSGAMHPAAAGVPISTLLGPPNGQAGKSPAAPSKSPVRRSMRTIAVPVSSTLATASTAPVQDKSEEKQLQTPKAAEEAPATPASAEPTKAETPAEPVVPDTAPQDSSLLDKHPASPDVPLADNAKARAEQERLARIAEQEKIIASRQYYLPVKDTDKKRSNDRAILWLVLAFLAVVVWLDLVLDAGIVRIGNIHALTHFFKR